MFAIHAFLKGSLPNLLFAHLLLLRGETRKAISDSTPQLILQTRPGCWNKHNQRTLAPSISPAAVNPEQLPRLTSCSSWEGETSLYGDGHCERAALLQPRSRGSHRGCPSDSGRPEPRTAQAGTHRCAASLGSSWPASAGPAGGSEAPSPPRPTA